MAVYKTAIPAEPEPPQTFRVILKGMVINMKTRTFSIVLLTVIAICLALTLAHLIYVVYAYRHCSIIYFIGKELWG